MNDNLSAGKHVIPSERLEYADLMRAAGCIAVVLLHATTAGVIYDFNTIKPALWWPAYTISVASIWCVPIFIMLSGCLLLDPEKIEPMKDFFKKRGIRILVPLLFWSAVYIGWRILKCRITGRDPLSSWDIIEFLLLGRPYGHLYFIFAVTGLYVFTPFFRILISNISKEYFFVLALLGVIFPAADVTAVALTGGTHHWTAFSFFAPFIGYFLMGFALKDVVLSRKWTLAAVGGVLVCIALSVSTTYLGHAAYGMERMISWSYTFTSPVVVLMSILIFMLFRSSRTLLKLVDMEHVLGRLMIKYVSPASFGIYLIHMLFLEPLKHFVLKGQQYTDPLYVPILFLMTFFCSLFGTLIILKIPYLRLVVGAPK